LRVLGGGLLARSERAPAEGNPILRSRGFGESHFYSFSPSFSSRSIQVEKPDLYLAVGTLVEQAVEAVVERVAVYVDLLDREEERDEAEIDQFDIFVIEIVVVTVIEIAIKSKEVLTELFAELLMLFTAVVASRCRFLNGEEHYCQHKPP
jgi:hypothetical protein